MESMSEYFRNYYRPFFRRYDNNSASDYCRCVWYTNLFDCSILALGSTFYLYGEHVIMKFEQLSLPAAILHSRWISKRNNTVWNGSIYRISILSMGRIFSREEGNHETPSWSNCRYRCNEMSRLTKQGYYTNHPWSMKFIRFVGEELFSPLDRDLIPFDIRHVNNCKMPRDLSHFRNNCWIGKKNFVKEI